MAPTLGVVLRRARDVRALTAVDAARAASISGAYLSKLENDAVKRPSPPVLLQLSEALGLPYADLMRLAGYHVPGDANGNAAAAAVGVALFGDLSDDERDVLLEYLAWYRSRRRTSGRLAATDPAPA
jgi:transcriptional regulator with XRE-family HTH domain